MLVSAATDEGPGISRGRVDKGFRYAGASGMPVRDAATLSRMRALAILDTAQIWSQA